MRFALINNELIEAQLGLRGICPGCGQPVIAKCGTIKVHHWAHQSTVMCDKWWESETEWHRSWKSKFPNEWQEVFLRNEQTGEKHIADVRTEYELILEFQYSYLNPQKRTARERFYQNMVWVVDATRLKYDYIRLCKGQQYIQPTDQPKIYHVTEPDKCLPAAWLNSSVPVIFDFLGVTPIDDPLGLRAPLHCLLPTQGRRTATLVQLPRNAFIKSVISGDWSARINKLMHSSTIKCLN